MNNHYHNIFYNTNLLSKEQKLTILREAKELSYEWWVDILKNSSFSRKRIEMSFEDILLKLDTKSHFVFIHRRGYENWKGKEMFDWKLEIGFCTMSMGDTHYLWIYLKEEEVEKFVEKYNLVKL